MVDEFQDTNRLQLDILEALERDNLFAVGDEFQSIYGFRHADVTIFRERRAALGEERTRLLTANFRSREELLDVLNGAFAPQWAERFAPLLAGGTESDSGELRLFDPGEPGDTEPRVELLVTDSRGWEDDDRLGLTGVEAKPHRRAEARVIAHRLRRELEAGRAARDIVVLVRATASLRLFEEALEEQGVPTYVVGGRGYWSQQPVRDGLAYLAALANPLDEEALLGTLASPFCGVGSDALILLSQGEGRVGHAARRGPARAPRRGRRAAAAVRRLLRRRARARRAAAGRGAARAGARGDRLRPRRPRPRRRRAAAGQPAQADAAGARVRARRGAGSARLPRLRGHARPRRRPRGRGAARVRGPRRRAADDDPPRQGARVPGRLRRGPRPPGRRPDRAAAARRRRRGRAAALDPRRRRDRARAGLRAARRRDGRERGRRGAPPLLRRHDPRLRPPHPLRHRRPGEARPAAPRRAADRLDPAGAHRRRAAGGPRGPRLVRRPPDAHPRPPGHPGHHRARRAGRACADRHTRHRAAGQGEGRARALGRPARSPAPELHRARPIRQMSL